MSFTVLSADGVGIYWDHSLFQPFEPIAAGAEAVFEVSCPLDLITGAYALKFAIGRGNPTSNDAERLVDDVALLVPPQRLSVYVSGSETAKGLVDLRARFALVPRDRAVATKSDDGRVPGAAD
jgi:hypothetical protein